MKVRAHLCSPMVCHPSQWSDCSVSQQPTESAPLNEAHIEAPEESSEDAKKEEKRGLFYYDKALEEKAYKNKAWALFFLVIIILGSFIFEATPANGITFCPYKLITGIDCPGCGMTRSWVHLVAGSFTEAVRFNPFGPILFTLAVFKVIFLSFEVYKKRWLVITPWEKVKVPFMSAVAIGMIGLGIYRLYLFFFA